MPPPDADLMPFPFASAPPGATSPYAIIEIEPHSLPPPVDGYTDLVFEDDDLEPVRPERSSREATAESKGVPDASRPGEVAPPSGGRERHERSAPRMLVPEALVLAAFLIVGGLTAVVALGGRSGHGTPPPVAAQPVPVPAPRIPATPPATRAPWAPRPPIDIPPLEPAPAPPVQGIVALETAPLAGDGSR